MSEGSQEGGRKRGKEEKGRERVRGTVKRGAELRGKRDKEKWREGKCVRICVSTCVQGRVWAGGGALPSLPGRCMVGRQDAEPPLFRPPRGSIKLNNIVGSNLFFEKNCQRFSQNALQFDRT